MAPIIDTHVHVVAADGPEFPHHHAGLPVDGWWDEQPNAIEDQLAVMDAAGVGGVCLVQCKAAYSFDNAYAAAAARTHPTRATSVSIIDMAADDRIAQLDRWADAGMGATRIFDIPTASPSWLDDPATRPLWDHAVARGVRLVVCLLPESLGRLATPLSWVGPDVPVALDHCGFADLAAGPDGVGVADLAALARLPNLRCKVTTNVLHAAVAAGRDPRDVLEHLAELFGAHRLMWGSDYANTHGVPYAELLDLGRHACSRLTADEQAGYLGGNAAAMWPELATAAPARLG